MGVCSQCNNTEQELRSVPLCLLLQVYIIFGVSWKELTFGSPRCSICKRSDYRHMRMCKRSDYRHMEAYLTYIAAYSHLF